MEYPEHSQSNNTHHLVVKSPSDLLTFWRLIFSFLLVFSCVLFSTAVEPTEVFPGADGYGAVQGGELPIAQVFKGQDAVGYVYLTTDIVNTRGYSSKPIDTLVALDNEGEIVGAKLVKHDEPIVLIGIPESRMVEFINGYVGMNFIKNP